MLALYRRHRRDCKGSHAEELRTSEYDERKKGWRRCECPIFLSGTLHGKFKRQTTGKWEWDEARLAAAEWETLGRWNATRHETVTTSATKKDAVESATISDATEAFLASCRDRGIAHPTLAKYKTFTKQLLAFAEQRGCVHVEQLTILDMDKFYSSWKDGKRSRAKKLERLKSFVKFCVKRKWLRENIAEDLQAPEGSSISASKTPFTDDELTRIYAACDSIGPPKPPGPGYRNWGGEDLKDFIMLSIHTGLRISDIATFDITKRLKGNDVFLRMHKTRKELYTWIPDWLVERLRKRENRYGSLVFRTGNSLVMRTMAELWRVKLARVFALAGPFEETPTPHRLRHTFVRILLQKGVPVADVAELIGDTEEIVRRHYAKWVVERQARLTRILQEAFDDHPKPRMVAIR